MDQVIETDRKDDLSGFINLNFISKNSLSECCAKNIPGYNPERFEPIAIRFYLGKETTVTVFAKDNENHNTNQADAGKIPVKKFKLTADFLTRLLPYIDHCNFTLTTGEYPIDEMEVINK
ncbi:MAG: hypothetical protein ABI772_05605 [Bacteroidota bacterium]